MNAQQFAMMGHKGLYFLLELFFSDYIGNTFIIQNSNIESKHSL